MIITLFTTPNCQQCNASKRKLKLLGLPHRLIDVSQSPQDLAQLKSMGYTHAPVTLVEAGGVRRHWYGYDPTALESLSKGVLQ